MVPLRTSVPSRMVTGVRSGPAAGWVLGGWWMWQVGAAPCLMVGGGAMRDLGGGVCDLE